MDHSSPTKFVTAPSNSLFCPLCHHLFRDPVISTRCGHTFCRPCVEGSTDIVCYADNTVIGCVDIVPNRAVKGQLDDLLIWCKHTLYRVDSDEDFQIDEEGCMEQITMGQRSAHEDECLKAWLPCPNSSNHCGKFRKQDFDDHVQVCPHNACKHNEKGCEFKGTVEQVQQHMCNCSHSNTVVEWDLLSTSDGDIANDGLQAKYLVKAVKNLNDRVTSLEKSKEEIIKHIEKCSSSVINLSIQVEKLSQTMEHMRVTQNVMVRDHMHSIPDIPATECRRTVSTIGLHTFGPPPRTRSTSGCTSSAHMFSFKETKMETWRMPLSFKCVGTFRGHNGGIRAIVSKGKYIFSGGPDLCIKVWDIREKDMKNSRGCIATLTSHTGEIHAMCTAGRYMYSAGSDKAIKVWEIDKLNLFNTREFVGKKSNISKYESNSDEISHLQTQEAHSDVIGALCSTGKYIFSGSYSSIKVWHVVSLELVQTVVDIHHWVRAFAVQPKRKIVYSGSHNTVHIWSAEEPFKCLGELAHCHGSVYSLAVTNQYLVIGTYNQNTHLYDVVTHKHVKVLNAHLGIINDLLVSPSGNFLFTASYDHTVQLWDLVKLLPVQVLSRHEGSVNCMAIRGDMIFTGSEDKEIKVYVYYQGLASKNLMVV